LGDVEETIYVVEDEEDTDGDLKVGKLGVPDSPVAILTTFQTITRKSEMLFVRGKCVRVSASWTHLIFSRGQRSAHLTTSANMMRLVQHDGFG